MRQKILIVDDENDILTLLEYNLQKAGFHVISAQDGPEAVNAAKKERPDLIILDIMLPSCCQAWKAQRSAKSSRAMKLQDIFRL